MKQLLVTSITKRNLHHMLRLHIQGNISRVGHEVVGKQALSVAVVASIVMPSVANAEVVRKRVNTFPLYYTFNGSDE